MTITNKRTVRLGDESEGSTLKALAEEPPLDALEIVLSENAASCFVPMELALVPLTPTATVTIQIPKQEQQQQNTLLDLVHQAFLLAGMVATGEQVQGDRRIIVATKKSTKAPTPLTKSSNDTMLIDEDNLLTDASNLLAPPPDMSAAAAASDDCAGREPCDNCTCGRATDSSKPSEVASSSCGKCHLGDAFRCANCPHLGKPAFKPGEEHLVLDLQDDL